MPLYIVEDKMEEPSYDGPQIYVACLSAYNNGKLHGKWIDANQEPEDIEAEVQEMLKASPEPNAEEWAIHDYQGFEDIKIEEYESFETVSRIAKLLDEHGEAFAAYYNNQCDIDEAEANFEEAFQGEYKDEEDFAYESMRSCYTIPDYLENYIDYSAYARDLFMGDYFSSDAPGGKIYVFRSL